jgi:hypothetical protein
MSVSVAGIYAGFVLGPKGLASARTTGFAPASPVLSLTPIATGVIANFSVPLTTSADLQSGWRVSWSAEGGASTGSSDLALSASSFTVPLATAGSQVTVSVSALYTSVAGVVAGPVASAASASLPAVGLSALGGLTRISVSVEAPAASSAGTPAAYAVGLSADGRTELVELFRNFCQHHPVGTHS